MKQRISFFILALVMVALADVGYSQITRQDTLILEQPPDSLIILDSNVVRKSWFTKDYPNPKKAAIMSLVVPGAGQVYNKGIWYVKVPVIYAALGGMVYLIDFNQSRYRRFRDAYRLKLQDQPHEFTNTRLDNERTLRVLRDNYDKNTQLSYVGIVAVYALQSVEAFVNAHLNSFDINDDLSLQLKPNFDTDLMSGQAVVGVGVVLRFE
jgi:hypothetical protein